jgi:hypothetical protein
MRTERCLKCGTVGHRRERCPTKDHKAAAAAISKVLAAAYKAGEIKNGKDKKQEN